MRAGNPWNATRSRAMRIQRHSAASSANISSAASIGHANVVGISRECSPAERSLALTEQRTHIFRHEARNVKRVFHARALRLRTNVVAVVEGHRAARAATRASLPRGVPSTASIARCSVCRFAFAQASSLQQVTCRRHVAVERVVRRRLIGQRRRERRHAAQVRAARRRRCLRARSIARRDRAATRRACRAPRPGLRRRFVEVPRREPTLDPLADRPRSPAPRRRSSSRPAAGRRPCRRGRR